MEKSKRTGSPESSCPQRRGDVRGHPPACAGVLRQAQAVSEADHVGIERNDQLAGRKRRPDAEVYLVGADHPAQKQIQPLARAARRRSRKEVTDTGTLGHAPVGAADVQGQCPASRSCRAPDRCLSMPGPVPFDEEMLRCCPGCSSICRRIQSSATRSTPARPAVHHRAQLRMWRRRIEPTHEFRGMRPHDPEQRGDRVQHARNAAERQRRRAEPRDLAILVPRERPHQMNRDRQPTLRGCRSGTAHPAPARALA